MQREGGKLNGCGEISVRDHAATDLVASVFMRLKHEEATLHFILLCCGKLHALHVWHADVTADAANVLHPFLPAQQPEPGCSCMKPRTGVDS